MKQPYLEAYILVNAEVEVKICAGAASIPVKVS
jgi:hypothetical protein